MPKLHERDEPPGAPGPPGESPGANSSLVAFLASWRFLTSLSSSRSRRARAATAGGGGFSDPTAACPRETAARSTPTDRSRRRTPRTLGDAPMVDVGGGGPAIVYAQTKDTLYQLDPIKNTLTSVGAFTGCTEVLDIALDKDSNMFATTLDGLFTIRPQDREVHAGRERERVPKLALVRPRGHAARPGGRGVLVGYVADTYVRIDTKSGKITMMGSIGKELLVERRHRLGQGRRHLLLTVKGGPQGHVQRLSSSRSTRRRAGGSSTGDRSSTRTSSGSRSGVAPSTASTRRATSSRSSFTGLAYMQITTIPGPDRASRPAVVRGGVVDEDRAARSGEVRRNAPFGSRPRRHDLPA